MQPVTPNYPEMNSSSGFKKRNLLRPPSSSGLKEKQFLRTIDISQPQAAVSSMLKSELSAIQEDISQLDIDKKIRLGESTLEKGYVLTLKKWLRDVQSTTEKEEDEIRILKHMNVNDLSSGFKKLWKVVGLLDSMIVRSTELQVISLLKYDDLFYSLCKDYTPVTKKLSALSQGFNAGTFQAAQVLVQRQQDLFSLVSRMRKATSTSSNNNESDAVISKLQEENAKLSSFLDKLTEELKTKKQQQQQEPKPVPLTVSSTNKPENATLKVDKSILDSVCSQVSQRYLFQIDALNKQVEQLLNEEARLRQQLKMSQDKQQMLEIDLKEASLRPVRQNQSQSFEAALQQQMTHMKTGYEAKINKLMTEFSMRQREMKRKENEYRVEAEKVKFERSLLLKKYDLMK